MKIDEVRQTPDAAVDLEQARVHRAEQPLAGIGELQAAHAASEQRAAELVLAGEHREVRKLPDPAVPQPDRIHGLQAARVIGVGPAYVLIRHILPNVMSPVLVIATINLALAIITAATIYIFHGNIKVAAIFGVAMTINLMVAGFAGCALPIIMTRLKVDPAITSGVFLTTFTDIVGFFTFLGLATLVLL